jgi:hypothetical protein
MNIYYLLMYLNCLVNIYFYYFYKSANVGVFKLSIPQMCFRQIYIESVFLVNTH